jgi:hypothetical protein
VYFEGDVMNQPGLFEGAPERSCDDRFDIFWNLYPAVRRTGKAKAREAFERLQLTWQQWARLRYILPLQAASSQWTEHPRWIPHPTTYLNNRRFDDEPDAYTTLPPTTAELEVAHRVRKNSARGCPHTPGCGNWRDCIDKIVASNRQRRDA